MPKFKCTLCDIRPASRLCPLENGASVCSKCCAEKRSLDCGECHYYLEAENYAIERFKSTGKHPFTLDMRHIEDIQIAHARKSAFWSEVRQDSAMLHKQRRGDGEQA